ncbi:MAG: CshA/CshB family fibrillar adhesin-related protein [Arcanobacterium sp.]|nr:CshA/CshB family fibrillar adhesin-related protein [Arcanobacterium sp.]
MALSLKRVRNILAGSLAGALVLSGLNLPSAQAAPIALTPAGSSMSITKLNEQIVWANFGDANISGAGYNVLPDGKKAFQIGTVYTQELQPGFVIRAEVVELKPIGEDANVNWHLPTPGTPTPEHIIARGDDTNWSHLYLAGMPSNGLASVGSAQNGGNIGITFKVTATFNGTPVIPSVIVADGEEAKGNEAQRYVTTGTGWDLLADVKKDASFASYSDPKFAAVPYLPGWSPRGGHEYDPSLWQNDAPDKGLGTDTFGALVTRQDRASVPIVETAAKTTDGMNVSVYINSSGMQAVRIGFVLYDQGDAPESYGTAKHLTRQIAGYKNPQLGRIAPDILMNPTGGEWNQDDLSDNADEGVSQIHATGADTFEYYLASDITYTMPIYAEPSSQGTSYIRGWIDFNNNGTFDSNEASETTPVSTAGPVNLVFPNPPQITDINISELGARIRISDDAADVLEPTGFATSGEVEDFKFFIKHPPRGEKKTTTGEQGQVQNAKATFTAPGVIEPTTNPNSIDPNVPIKIVTADGTLVDTWTEPGEGTYVVDASGNITFTPEPQFTGTAKGIVLRAVDMNGQSTGWTSQTQAQTNAGLEVLPNVNNGVNGTVTMDSVYIPTVTPVVPTATNDTTMGPQGQPQESALTYTAGSTNVPLDFSTTTFVDANGDPIAGSTIPAMKDGVEVGTFTLDPATGQVVFQPNPDFIGTPDSVRVQVKDANGTPAVATYTPNVFPVTPIGTPATSSGLQGQVQTGTPTFQGGNENVPVTITADNPAKLIDPEGNPVDTTPALKDGKPVGTYTIDPETGVVTFTPNKDFVGTPDPAVIQAKDTNGTPATTTYTPTVFPVTPTAGNSETVDKPNVPQNSNLTFLPGNEQVPLDFSTTTFVDANGDPIAGSTIPAMKDGVEVGTFTLDPATGQVVFQPKQDYVGSVDPIRVQVRDINGTPAVATYTPKVTPPLPSSTPVTTVGKQGETQKGIPSFNDGFGNPIVPSADNPAKLIDPFTGKVTDSPTVPALKDGNPVGTYTIDPETGVVTFTPNKDFVGVPDLARVQLNDPWGQPVTGFYQPVVTPSCNCGDVPPVLTPPNPSQSTPNKPGKLALTGAQLGIMGTLMIFVTGIGFAVFFSRRKQNEC